MARGVPEVQCEGSACRALLATAAAWALLVHVNALRGLVAQADVRE